MLYKENSINITSVGIAQVDGRGYARGSELSDV